MGDIWELVEKKWYLRDGEMDYEYYWKTIKTCQSFDQVQKEWISKHKELIKKKQVYDPKALDLRIKFRGVYTTLALDEYDSDMREMIIQRLNDEYDIEKSKRPELYTYTSIPYKRDADGNIKSV